MLAERREVGVVLEPDGQAERTLELAFQRAALEAGDVLDDPHDARPTLDHAGDADDDGVDPVGVETGRLRQRRAQALDRLDRLRRFGGLQLDVLARADFAGQVAERASDEPCAEVEPEHDRGLRDGLEVDRAVARAVGSLRCLADEVGLKERL